MTLESCLTFKDHLLQIIASQLYHLPHRHKETGNGGHGQLIALGFSTAHGKQSFPQCTVGSLPERTVLCELHQDENNSSLPTAATGDHPIGYSTPQTAAVWATSMGCSPSQTGCSRMGFTLHGPSAGSGPPLTSICSSIVLSMG